MIYHLLKSIKQIFSIWQQIEPFQYFKIYIEKDIINRIRWKSIRMFPKAKEIFKLFLQCSICFLLNKIALIVNTWHGLRQSHAWPVHTKRWLHFPMSLDATSCLTKRNQLLNFSTFLWSSKFVRHNLYAMFTIHINQKCLERCQNHFIVTGSSGKDNFLEHFHVV